MTSEHVLPEVQHIPWGPGLLADPVNRNIQSVPYCTFNCFVLYIQAFWVQTLLIKVILWLTGAPLTPGTPFAPLGPSLPYEEVTLIHARYFSIKINNKMYNIGHLGDRWPLTGGPGDPANPIAPISPWNTLESSQWDNSYCMNISTQHVEVTVGDNR